MERRVEANELNNISSDQSNRSQLMTYDNGQLKRSLVVCFLLHAFAQRDLSESLRLAGIKIDVQSVNKSRTMVRN